MSPRENEPEGTAGGVTNFVVDRQVGFMMRVALQRHTLIFTTRMTEELTQSQFAVMAKLLEVGARSQNYLGRLVHLDAATIKGVVDRLALRSLISTFPDPKDKRIRAVQLTEEGKRVVSEAIPVAVEISDETLAPLNKEEQKALTALLGKLT